MTKPSSNFLGIADGYNKDGDKEMRNNEFNSAIDCYTEGIGVNCKDDKLNALLYTNRANVHFLRGENLCFVVACLLPG